MYNSVINLSPSVPGQFWREGKHKIHNVVLCKNWSCLVLHFQGFAKDVIKLRIWFQWEMLNESTNNCLFYESFFIFNGAQPVQHGKSYLFLKMFVNVLDSRLSNNLSALNITFNLLNLTKNKCSNHTIALKSILKLSIKLHSFAVTKLPSCHEWHKMLKNII